MTAPHADRKAHTHSSHTLSTFYGSVEPVQLSRAQSFVALGATSALVFGKICYGETEIEGGPVSEK